MLIWRRFESCCPIPGCGIRDHLSYSICRTVQSLSPILICERSHFQNTGCGLPGKDISHLLSSLCSFGLPPQWYHDENDEAINFVAGVLRFRFCGGEDRWCNSGATVDEQDCLNVDQAQLSGLFSARIFPHPK